MKHPVDLATLLGFVASGGLAAFAEPLGSLFPSHGPQIVNSIALVTAMCSTALHLFFNQQPEKEPHK